MKFIAIKDFGDFQHYKNRRPPWIKFYGSVLTDGKLMQMPEAAQAQLFKLWLLASQMGHPLPNNPKLLAGKIGVQGKSHIPTLIAAGYLIPIGASEPPRPCEPDASADASKSLGHVEQRTEDRGTEEDVVVGARDISSVTPTNIAVWCNTAITARWGEQPSPLTAAQSVSLVEAVEGVPWELVRAAIGEACRASKNTIPPRHPNYFRAAILSAQEQDAARRDAAANPNAVPAIRIIPTPARSSAIEDETLWSELQAVVSRLSRRELNAEEFNALPYPLRAGLRSIGGWQAVNETKPGSLHFVRRDFLIAYREATHTKATA